jgi:hypothetical protein
MHDELIFQKILFIHPIKLYNFKLAGNFSAACGTIVVAPSNISIFK